MDEIAIFFFQYRVDSLCLKLNRRLRRGKQHCTRVSDDRQKVAVFVTVVIKRGKILLNSLPKVSVYSGQRVRDNIYAVQLW